MVVENSKPHHHKHITCFNYGIFMYYMGVNVCVFVSWSPFRPAIHCVRVVRTRTLLQSERNLYERGPKKKMPPSELGTHKV